jgi:hypothetical protein
MVKAPSGRVPARGTTLAAAVVIGGPPLSSSSAWEPLIWLFDGAAYATMVARVGQHSHGEHAIYRGKSYELVAEADSSRSLPKILTKS